MNLSKREYQNFLNFELVQKKRFLFIFLSLIFIPSFIQVLPTDTQPWYLVAIILAAFSFLKDDIQLKFFFTLLAFFSFLLFFRQFMFPDEQISKSLSYSFFLLMLPLMSMEMIKFLRSYFFQILIFHLLFALLLSALSDSLYKLIYSAREIRTLGLRSISFSFPEPSYAAKVLILTSLGLYYFNEDSGQKYKYYLLVSFALFTLSITGLALGSLAVLSLMSLRSKLIVSFFGITLFYLVYTELISLPGRLYLIQRAIQSLDFNLILIDESFVNRIQAFELILLEFQRFSVYGSTLSTDAVSFFSLVYLGWPGMLVIVFSVLNFIILLLRGKVFLFLIFVFCSFSDSFVYPATAIFIMGCFYNNLIFFSKTYKKFNPRINNYA